MRGRPALGGAKLRARAEGDQARLRGNAEALRGLGHAHRVGPQPRLGQVLRQAGAGLERQPRVVLHHGRALVAGRIAMADIEQAEAGFAAIADAQRDAGQPGDQRGLERVRQHIGRVVAFVLELLGEHQPCRELQLAVRQFAGEDLVDLGHAGQHRRHPFRGEGVDLQARMARFHEGEERLRHQGVADPVGGDDEGFFHEWGAAGRVGVAQAARATHANAPARRMAGRSIGVVRSSVGRVSGDP